MLFFAAPTLLLILRLVAFLILLVLATIRRGLVLFLVAFSFLFLVLLTALLLVLLILLAALLLILFILLAALLVFLVLLAALLLVFFVLLTALLLILLLVLLLLVFFRLLLLELLEQILDALFVFLGLRVVGTRLERGFVFSDSVFPIGDFLLLVLLTFTLTEERIAEVEFGGGTQERIVGQHRSRKEFRGLAVILQTVCRRAGVELQSRRIGLHAQPLLEFLTGLLVISGVVFVQAGRPPGRSREQPESCRGERAATALADQSLQAEQRDGGTQGPLVALDRTT